MPELEIDCITTAELVRATGISPHNVDQFRKAGILRAFKGKPEHGLGFNFYSLKDVLNVAVALELKRRGFKTEQVIGCLQWLLERELPELKEQWEQGRVLMLAVGDTPAFPRLLSHTEVFDNPDVDLHATFQAGISVVLIDTSEAPTSQHLVQLFVEHVPRNLRQRLRRHPEFLLPRLFPAPHTHTASILRQILREHQQTR